MAHADVITLNGSQLVRLPDEYRFDTDTVAIRREGTAVILEPPHPEKWPEGFFDSIRIDDPDFCRPPQGQMPGAPKLD